MSPSNNPFWTFSLETYQQPGVAAACLDLQDRHGLDVNLLLFCCWAACCGRPLDHEELERLDALAGPWRQNVVLPLRGVRRWLKMRERAPGVLSLRNAVKKHELEAERLQQDSLHAALPLDAAESPPGWSRLAAANLRSYLAVKGEEDADLTALLEALA